MKLLRAPHGAMKGTGARIARARKTAVVFEHKLLESYQPKHQRAMKFMHRLLEKANLPEERLVNALGAERGFAIARACSKADTVLEAANFAVMGFSLVYLTGVLSPYVDPYVEPVVRFISETLGRVQTGLQSKPLSVFILASCASKLTVKVGAYIELFQMFVVDSLVHHSKKQENSVVKGQLAKYTHQSIREQFWDTVLFWLPVPFIELLRRGAAIRSEKRQLKAIEILGREIAKKEGENRELRVA